MIPRQIVRHVVNATYQQLWWPTIGDSCAEEDLPVWDDLARGFIDPATGELLPTRESALDDLDAEPAAEPAHVLRFGRQLDYQGILATDEERIGKGVGYLTKYLTENIGATYGDPDEMTDRQLAHLQRLHAHIAVLPCSPRCANWLRYGVQPKDPSPELVPGQCEAKAHDREHLGLAGRRVLVSRDWTGKTLAQHAADRADVVRAVLEEAGIEAPDRDRCSATATRDGVSPPFVWTRIEHDAQDHLAYRDVLATSIRERVRWREQYEQAQQRTGPPPTPPGARSVTETARPAA